MTTQPRIDDLTPQTWPPSSPDEVLGLVKALYPPQRSAIFDVMRAYERLPLDELSRLTRLPVRSVSHHLRELYRVGIVAPDTEQADEQGRVWWRLEHRTVCWQLDDQEPGTAEYETAWAAVQAAIRRQNRSLLDFLSGPEPLDSPFREAMTVTDRVVLANPREMDSLWDRLNEAYKQWLADLPEQANDDEPERRPVRVSTWIHPVM